VKTNAARQLDRLGIKYELRDYEVDPDHLEAEVVADKIRLPYEKVFKTLLIRGDMNGLCMAVVPANAEVNFKALAQATGDRKMHMVPLKEVQPLTGYIRGGVTALACKKPYPVYIDSSAEQQNVISVSAGVRGTQILLKPADYIRAVEATLAPIAAPQTP
jgi:Cys-tRNA(Pro)/Cys-tRNA(Cys) deacylase